MIYDKAILLACGEGGSSPTGNHFAWTGAVTVGAYENAFADVSVYGYAAGDFGSCDPLELSFPGYTSSPSGNTEDTLMGVITLNEGFTSYIGLSCSSGIFIAEADFPSDMCIVRRDNANILMYMNYKFVDTVVVNGTTYTGHKFAFGDSSYFESLSDTPLFSASDIDTEVEIFIGSLADIPEGWI